MTHDIIAWLLAAGNPAVQHRTKTELLGQEDDLAETLAWITQKLPADWHKTKGLWYVYYVNALAECGLNRSLLPPEWFEPAMDRIQTKFDFSCESFMLLQAMVALGFAETPEIQKLLGQLCPGRLPDGGFLCERRKHKLDYVPKSCYKADYFALRLCSCCRRKGISLDIEDKLIAYFLDRNLLFSR